MRVEVISQRVNGKDSNPIVDIVVKGISNEDTEDPDVFMDKIRQAIKEISI